MLSSSQRTANPPRMTDLTSQNLEASSDGGPAAAQSPIYKDSALAAYAHDRINNSPLHLYLNNRKNNVTNQTRNSPTSTNGGD